MNAVREIANQLLDEMPDEMIENVISYIAFIRHEKKPHIFKELEKASVSSLDFWNNPMDEVWNDL